MLDDSCELENHRIRLSDLFANFIDGDSGVNRASELDITFPRLDAPETLRRENSIGETLNIPLGHQRPL